MSLFLLFSGKIFQQLIWNDIGRNCLLGHRKKIAKFLMRTFTCRSTFLYGLNTLQRQNTEISKQIFPEKEYRGLSPNFHIHVSVSNLYIPTIGLHIQLEEICRPLLLFPEKEYINGIFVAGYSISLYLMYRCSRPGPAQRSARLTRSRPRHSETRYLIGQYI
jgi:hypothetical protein